MSFRGKITGLLLIPLLLTYDFQGVILVLTSTKGLNNSYATAGDTGDFEFLKRQLENTATSDCPLLERSYVIPSGMNLSLADEIWLKIAPLISLGYNEKEILKAIDETGLPRKIEANGTTILIDYANLSVTRRLENGEVSVEIPVLCNSSLSSLYYEVKGVKKHIGLYNITIVRYYNVSVRTQDLYDVTYSREDSRFSKAILDLNGDLKNNVITVYFPNLEKPVFSEMCFNLLYYGVSLSLRVLEYKVYDIDSGGKRTDCFWIRVNATLRATRDVSRVMFRIRHGGGWVNKPWLILRRGEYASDHWVKWTPNDKLIVDFNTEGFGNRFILNFGEIVEKWNDSFSKVLSEDELKNLLEQPPYVELNLNRAPRFLRVDFAGEKVINKTIRVTNEEYERLARLGWRKDNSIFVDSGEIEWEYAVMNRTLGQCKSIRLFYNPLRVSRGELVHGLMLRNYANANVSYTLRLRTTTSLFFFFPKVDEGDTIIVLNKSSINHLLLVQQEPAVGDTVLELVNDGRVVAAVKVYLALKATMYWKGFWEGLASKLPGIMVTAGVMMVVGFLIPHRYVRPAYYLLLGLSVLMNLAQVALDIAEANRARDEMLVLAKTFENRSRDFLVRGEVEHTSECMSFALALRKEVNETMNNLLLNVLSDLAVGVSFDEVRIALGLKEPLARDELERQYKIGYARGRVIGAVVSCVLYITLFMMVNRIKVERVGQRLTVGQVLRLIVRGIYNWITPAIWDAVILTLGKIKGFADRVIDLLLANKYSRRFGDAVGNLLQGVEGAPSKVKDILDTSSQFSKNVLENVPSRGSAKKILDALGMIIEQYSPEDLGKKGGIVTRSIVSMWIKDGDSAIDSLNNWLSKNMGDLDRMAALEEVLMAIGGDAVKGVGLKIENIVNSCFDIKNKYSRDVMEAFLSKVVKHPDVLEEILVKLNSFDFVEKPHRVLLKKGVESTLDMGEGNKVGLGTYVVRVYWEYGEKNGVIGFSVKKNIESHRINIAMEQVNQILDQVGSDEAKILVIKVELFDYRLFFPAEFIVNDKKITLDLFNNEMEVNGVTYKFIAYQDVHAGKIRIDAGFEGKNIEGKNLVLSFYQDSKLGIKHDDGSRLIKEIEIDPKRDLMRIEYLKGDEKHAEYSFNSKPLDAQIGRISCEIAVRSQERTRLKEELFRLIGYDALIELENRIGDINEEERIMLLLHFDNGKTAYCGNKDLRVHVPSGAGKITYIDIIALKELSDIKKCAARVLEDPQDTHRKGKLGEAIVEKMFMDIILAEIAEKSGIPKNELVTKPLGKDGEPDFEIDVSGTGERIAIVEVKYVGDPENIEVFGKQLNEARMQIRNRFNDPDWTTSYGVVVIIAWPPEKIIKDESYPENVGSYKNPHIEYYSREGG